MAGRCGCAVGCGCNLQVQEPLYQEGTGSAQDPWIIGLEYDGYTDCDAIVACVGANLGPGLGFDPEAGEIQARLEPGGGMSFGPGGGLAVVGDGPDPACCGRTVDDLPPAPGVVGAERLAGYMHPPNSPHGLEYCIANGVDITGVCVAGTADGVGAIMDDASGLIRAARTSVYGDIPVTQMTSDAVSAVYSYAGNVDDPYMITDGSRGNRGGGWYGYLAQRHHLMLLPQFLAQLGAKTVALLDCRLSPGAQGSETASAAAAMRAVEQMCAHNSSIIGVSSPTTVPAIANAGMVAALVSPEPGTWGTTALPWPVAEVTASGATWMLLDRFYADSVFAAYEAAGVQVLMRGATRHVDRARVEALGIRGGYGMDPVYYRGPDVHDYRTGGDPWDQRRMALGQLTFATDVRGLLGWHVRGYTQGTPATSPQPDDSGGLALPPDFGRQTGRVSVLAGRLCPLPTPDSYRARVEMKFMQTNGLARNKMSILFGADTDADTYGWPDDPDRNPHGMPSGQQTLYRAWQRSTGEIGIGVWAGPGAPLTTLAQVSSPPPASNVWSGYELIVTPTAISWTRVLANGDTYTATANDTTYRGPYLFLEKEESFGDLAPAPFRGKFRGLHVDPI